MNAARAELEQATFATAVAIADARASLEDVRLAAELEEAALNAFAASGPEALAELELEPEIGL